MLYFTEKVEAQCDRSEMGGVEINLDENEDGSNENYTEKGIINPQNNRD